MFSEAVAQTSSLKKMFLEISQMSEFYEISNNTFFTGHLWWLLLGFSLCFSGFYWEMTKFVFSKFSWHSFQIQGYSMFSNLQPIISAGIYLFEVSNRNTRAIYENCSKLTIKTSERCNWHCYGVFIANFEQISLIFLAFLLLSLNK